MLDETAFWGNQQWLVVSHPDHVPSTFPTPFASGYRARRMLHKHWANFFSTRFTLQWQFGVHRGHSVAGEELDRFLGFLRVLVDRGVVRW